MTTYVDRVYRPLGAARDLFHYRGPEVLMVGAAGTGKSRACLEKVHAIMLANPGAKWLLVRKTAESLSASTLATWRDLVIPEAAARGIVDYYGGSREQPAQYRYTNGSRVYLGGMDKPLKIMSTEYDGAFVDEAIELTEEDWESISARLRYGRVSFQQLIGATNPGPDFHWLKRRCDRGATHLLTSVHADNPRYVNGDGTLTDAGEAYMARLQGLTGVRRLRLLQGLWAAAEGLIWEGWNPAVHVAPFDLDPTWPRSLAVDFGFTNPMVVQWWAEDSDGRLLMYRELYGTGRLVEDVAAEVARLNAADAERHGPGAVPYWAVCDHDAEGRATFTRHSGVSTKAADKRVTRGIQAVAERLAVAGDGRPRVILHPDALVRRDESLAEAGKPTCTADEIPGYVWDASTRAKREAEAPLKENDHGCDALRYRVMHADGRRLPRMRMAG